MDNKKILEQCNEIFGKTERSSFFTPDEDYENTLRQEIINAPYQTYDHYSLPFEGVEIVPYENLPASITSPHKIANIIKSVRLHLERQQKEETEFSDDISKRIKIYLKKQRQNEPLIDLAEKIREVQQNSRQHIFGIQLKNIFALGYKYKGSNNFCLLKGSRIEMHSECPTGNLLDCRRINFISKDCSFKDWYYQLKHDKLCISASEAAFFVFGKSIQDLSWTDGNGISLDDYYKNSANPDKEGLPINGFRKRQRITEVPHHYFYLKKNKNRYCDAKGYYDIKSNNFIIKKGSLLSLITSSSCYNTNIGLYRDDFLQKYCTAEALGFRLNCDYVCTSPSEAVVYCLGRSGSGWSEWVDEYGNTMKSFYKKD